MEQNNEKQAFELSVTARDDGTLVAAYIRFRKGKARRTREVIAETLIADYDEHDNLLGVEILGPVKLAELAKLVEQPRRRSFRKFVKHSGPPSLLQT